MPDTMRTPVFHILLALAREDLHGLGIAQSIDSTTDGSVLWSYDTIRDFATVNGVAASGGAIDTGGPAIAHGMVLTTSGNGTWGGQRGNVLLAFGIE